MPLTDDQCPGCTSPKAGQICCDRCWDRAPRHLPGQPRWRSRKRSLARWGLRGNNDWDALESIDSALVTWLRANHIPDRQTEDIL